MARDDIYAAEVDCGAKQLTPEPDEVAHLGTDAIGSVRLITDTQGQVVARYDYLPFGALWNSAALQTSLAFAFMQRDVDTGQDYALARYVQSQTGRFTRPDDPGFSNPFDPQSMNLYTYARYNPLRWVDPTGHETISISVPAGILDDFFTFFRDSDWRAREGLVEEPEYQDGGGGGAQQAKPKAAQQSTSSATT